MYFKFLKYVSILLGHPRCKEIKCKFDKINKTIKIIRFYNIGLSGKFVPILKENWNAEDLNF